MELGNMVFGHSRGDFEVPREWGDYMNDLCESAGLSARGEPKFEYDSPPPGPDFFYGFNNETFTIRPYRMEVSCTCGQEAKLETWHKANKHRGMCYQTSLWAAKIPYDGGPELYKPLYDKHGMDFADFPSGCRVICTCDFMERFEAGDLGCREDCEVNEPNFHYKPTNFRVLWYKYPLRDSYANQDLTKEHFMDMLRVCAESLKAPT